jgi:periodic tryptophan protein 2
LAALAELVPQSPHLEHLLGWIQAVCIRHGDAVQRGGARSMPALRALQKAVGRVHEDLASICESNLYSLRYLCTVGSSELGVGREVQGGEEAGR